MGELADLVAEAIPEDTGHYPGRRERLLDMIADLEISERMLRRERDRMREGLTRNFVSDVDAHRDRDAALAAVTAVFDLGCRCLHIAEIERFDVNGRQFTIAKPIKSDLPGDARIAVLVPSRPPNPELLERASTLLMEQYIDAKAKEPK